MSPGFADERRLLAQAREWLNTREGKLRLWHFSRHQPYQGVPWEQRTQGDLLEEFYLSVAADIDDLTARQTSLDASELNRLDRLESLLRPTEDGEADSGDLLADYWDYCIEQGLPVDLDLKEAPPRDSWDHTE